MLPCNGVLHVNTYWCKYRYHRKLMYEYLTWFIRHINTAVLLPFEMPLYNHSRHETQGTRYNLSRTHVCCEWKRQDINNNCLFIVRWQFNPFSGNNRYEYLSSISCDSCSSRQFKHNVKSNITSVAPRTLYPPHVRFTAHS